MIFDEIIDINKYHVEETFRSWDIMKCIWLNYQHKWVDVFLENFEKYSAENLCRKNIILYWQFICKITGFIESNQKKEENYEKLRRIIKNIILFFKQYKVKHHCLELILIHYDFLSGLYDKAIESVILMSYKEKFGK